MTSALVVAAVLGGLVSFFDMSWRSCAVLVVGMFALFVFTLWRNQHDLLYQRRIYPQFIRPSQNPPGYRSPEEHGIEFDDVRLDSGDGETLHAWFLRHRRPETRPTLLFLHANAGNMGFRLPNLACMHRLLRMNIFVLSYRGYGESSGTPTEPGLVRDAEAAYQWLLRSPLVDSKRVVVFGRSMGGAVATALTERHGDVAALVLENTFTSISDVVDKIFPYLRPIKNLILRLRWETGRRIGSVRCPLLLLSGQKDEVVPPAQMQALYDLAVSSARRTIVRFPDGMHNDTWTKLGYTKALHEFLAAVMPEHAATLPPPPDVLTADPAAVIAAASSRRSSLASDTPGSPRSPGSPGPASPASPDKKDE